MRILKWLKYIEKKFKDYKFIGYGKNEFYDSTAFYNGSYYYKVATIDKNGNESSGAIYRVLLRDIESRNITLLLN